MNNNTKVPQKEKVEDKNKITITVKNDLTGDEEERLRAIVESKQSLLKKALEATELPILVTEKEVSFPWFSSHDIEGEADAYARFITALIKMAKEQKRVTAKDKKEENEKFAMRIFTVRLGLKGDDNKLIRKLLSHNLSGNSAWKSGAPEKKPTKVKDERNKPETQKDAPLPGTGKKVAKKANKGANKADNPAKPEAAKDAVPDGKEAKQ